MINHKNNMLWVNKYPVDVDSLSHIENMFNANIKERCDKENTRFYPDKIVIKNLPVSEYPFIVPDGDIAGVYWWEYGG